MATGFAPVLEPEKKAQQPTTGPLTPINEIQARLLNYVQDIPDPRVSRTQKHLLTDILVIAILAVVATRSLREITQRIRQPDFFPFTNFSSLPKNFLLPQTSRNHR